MTISHRSPAPLSDAGQLVMTSGLQHWITTGCTPYECEPAVGTMDAKFRRHHVAVLFTCHVHGDQLDTCDLDHALNQKVFNHEVDGRIVSVLHRNRAPKMFAISDAWGTPSAVTTIMLAEEY